MNLLDLLPQTKAEAASDAVALGAVSSPLWLHEMSGLGRDLLPWFGIAWLVVQIAIKIHTTYWKKK
ncbi:hypothetical protein JQ628_11260 [Bradyrhizobium lablabi]|uniref:hypothetical protein n=1 Tax=Bradyrhizobium lablabi TaxID=722472 RepID=UPI001BACBE5E|nr:hypothetical protein [Bradyrhizobium lablabi]MBR1122094.1 hypothetical protein [Bradyrhizobium lablabi]